MHMVHAIGLSYFNYAHENVINSQLCIYGTKVTNVLFTVSISFMYHDRFIRVYIYISAI